MNKHPWTTLAAALLATATLASQAQAAGRAALVEETLPSRPFHDSMNGSTAAAALGPGIGAAQLGIGSITLTNTGSTLRQVFVFAPVLSGGTNCDNATVIGGSTPRFYVMVPPDQTVHLTYPVPLVYKPISGNGNRTCVAFSGAAGIDITINGYIN